MRTLSLDMNLRECPVTIQFHWYGEEPDWDTMVVSALLPSIVAPEAMYWVEINDLLSEQDWYEIETEIYLNQKKLKQQAQDQEY